MSDEVTRLRATPQGPFTFRKENREDLRAVLDRLEAVEHELAQWRLGVTTEMTSEMSFEQSLEQWQRWYARLKARFGVRDV